MNLESLRLLIFALPMDILAILTSILGIILVYKIYTKRYTDHIKKTLLYVFLSLTIGYVLYSFSEVAWDVTNLLKGSFPEYGLIDVFWIIGVLFLYSGYVIFAIHIFKERAMLKKGIFIILTASLIAGSLSAYLIHHLIQLQAAARSVFFLDYYYPISSAIIFSVSLIVYFFFTTLKKLGRPLLFFALSNFFMFLGDLTYSYYSWTGIFGLIGILSESFYLLQYVFSSIALFLLLRLFKKKRNV